MAKNDKLVLAVLCFGMISAFIIWIFDPKPQELGDKLIQLIGR